MLSIKTLAERALGERFLLIPNGDYYFAGAGGAICAIGPASSVFALRYLSAREEYR